MTRQRSPSYPNISLPDAIARVRKVFDQDRQAPLDRNVVAKHIGYNGTSGAADKTIGSLRQYGLLEKAAKGELKVTQLAVDIFHPLDSKQKRRALMEAAYTPEVFRELSERFGVCVVPSEEAAKSYLVRQQYLDRAIGPIVAAYADTCQFLKQEGATEIAVPSDDSSQESETDDGPDDHEEPETAPVKVKTFRTSRPRFFGGSAPMADGMQRMLTQGMLSKDATFEIIVTGRIGAREIDTLIRKLEIDKELLADDAAADAEEG